MSDCIFETSVLKYKHGIDIWKRMKQERMHCTMKSGKEAAVDMNQDLIEVMMEVKDRKRFIRFLNFCVPRLNRDEPVRAIWNEWMRKAG